MEGIPLTRCQFLIPYVDILNGIGAPTDSLLTRFRLPTSLVEKADNFVPLLSALQFGEAAERIHGITDLGFEAARQTHIWHLSEKLQTAIDCSPTLLAALRQTCKWVPIEDTHLTMWLERHDDDVRVCSRLVRAKGLLHLEHSQWLQLIFPIHIVRHFAGSQWNPKTIAFEAHYTPTHETQSFWPHSRFLSGQHASWIDVPISHLSLPGRASAVLALPPADEDGPPGHEIVRSIRMMLPSYLDGRLPALAEVAEMAGLSSRSFQRKLSNAGLSYSDLVDAARFENAARLLRDTDSKIIEIAFSSGYADPAHFTRAFRRMAGVTPRQFREQSRPGSRNTPVDAC